jgi:hypothetical protein
VTAKPADPLAQIEAAQATLAAPDAPLDRLESARLDLQRIISGSEADLEEIRSRRKNELLAHAPAAEVDRKIEGLEKRAREVARRIEIANAVLSEVETRIVAAREVEIEAKRQARYDDATKLHISAAKHVREFLDRIAPEARKALQIYSESEAAVAAVNRDLPAGASPIKSLEDERRGELQTRETVVRRLRYFYLGNDRIVEVGRAEAAETSAGVWGVFVPSGSVQGGETFAGCRIVEFLELKVETLKSQPESLLTALRIPQFHEPYVTAGTSRRTVPAAEWDAANGQPVPRLAAE